MNRFRNLSLPFIIATIIIGLLVATFSPAEIQAQPDRLNPISPELATLIQSRQNSNNQSFRFIVTLKDQVDLTAERLPLAELPRRAAIVRTLQSVAEESQSHIIPDLDALQARSELKTYHSFWIFNGIAAEGTANAILTLAKNPHVTQIDIDHQIESIQPLEPITSTTKFPSADLPTVTSSGVATQTWGLERIRAPQVWHGLGITGTDVTVGIMDTGVDYTHPALVENYRGRQSDGSFSHAGNWFHAAVPTYTTPVDFDGHGTHVAGTAVGRHGIGVAPGAQWIAVSIADEDGLLLESYIHAGFEWLLAPDGKPELAPDLFNASWGGTGSTQFFLEDMNLLKQAGVIPVFAAGNSGPTAQTVGAPASYTNTIAIAATTQEDTTVWFSSRGPSPLHTGAAPIIAAPGTQVYSAQPDNQYAYLSGTSMATPHAAGALALLLSADKSIKNNRTLLSILAESAIPFESDHPNITSGYGMLDAVELVKDYLPNSSQVRGSIKGGGIPLANTTITLTANSGSFQITTNADGRYTTQLQPGSYAVEINHLAFAPYSSTLTVTPSQTTFNISLNRKPYGTLNGKITHSQGTPLKALVQIDVGLSNPVEITSGADGRYSIELPVGSYPLNIIKSGYKIGKATAPITNGQTLVQNFSLPTTQSILLVDAGKWSFREREKYYADAFIDMGTGWDTFTIDDPIYGHPELETLENYDVVIWSDPRYSPGYIGATDLISDYLGTGGNLLITGKLIARYDYQDLFSFDWLGRLAYAEPQKIITRTESIFGREQTEFASFNTPLDGPNTPDDQDAITTMLPRLSAKSELIFSHGQPHSEQNGVGIKAGHCEDYNLIYLGFGLSGVQGAENRTEIINSSLDWFTLPKQEAGIQWLTQDSTRPIVPSEAYPYDLSVYNRSETMTRTFQISAESTASTNILTQTMTLGPCQVGDTQITITIPAELDKDSPIQTILTVQDSQNGQISDTLNITHTTPATLLLVDDHRWYEQSNSYKAILDEIGIDYDVWTTHGDISQGSPSTTLLQEYPYVVWFTAYDWFAPLTKAEVTSLEAYLENDGRLFLTSQDFLYYHSETSLAQHYFGITGFTESVTPTVAYGDTLLNSSTHPDGNYPLIFDQSGNNGDRLFLSNSGTAVPLLWHDQGVGGAGNASKQTEPAWRTIFWAVPFEQLEDNGRTNVMRNVLGWLGDLGNSSITVDKPSVFRGQSQTYTINLNNRENGISQTVALTNTLPADLDYTPGSLTGGATWDANSRTISWTGTLTPGQSITFTYSATQQTAGTGQNRITIKSDKDPTHFQRGATYHIGGVNLSSSHISADLGPMTLTPIGSGIIFKRSRDITYTVELQNIGDQTALLVTATAFLPDHLSYVTNTAQTTSGSATVTDSTISWHGRLLPIEQAKITAKFTSNQFYLDDWLPAALTITSEGKNDNIQNWYIYNPQFIEAKHKVWFPIIGQSGKP